MYVQWSSLLLGTLWIYCVNCQDSIHYQNDTVTITEGENVTLYCEFKLSSSFKGLRWYKLNPGTSPVHLINGVSYAEIAEGRFTLNLKKESCFLHIEHPRVSDSALYLCAVHASSNLNKLIFGSGTTLSVTPKTERTIPSVYKLKSSRSDESLPNSVCLITDFPSPNKTLQINEKDVNLNEMAVLDESSDNKWRYSTVTWDNDDGACNGKYDENDLVTEYEAENTDESCSSISIDESFRTNPSLNTLSLTVLGWRVFTAKAIVFNLIITLRLWSS